ncbi:MAG: LPS assembly protein LptD [Pseudomonadota bacterium]
MFRLIPALGLLLPAAVSAADVCTVDAGPWEPWPDPGGGQVAVDAASADLSDPDVAVLEGGVVIRDVTQEVTADSIRYLREDDRVQAAGGVTYRTSELALEAESADMSLATETGALDDVVYRIREGNGQGDATVMELLGEDRSRLEDVRFTTCPIDDPDWTLEAEEMTIDQAEGRVDARGMRLRFKDVTLLALPRASFPLDDRRKSGFLLPTVGSSNDNGFDLAVPYYWNIAPNRDATLIPRIVTDRGGMLGLEYRYLTDNSYGELSGAYMPDDDLVDRHRGEARYRHATRFNDTLRLDVDFRHVSDAQYYEDFGGSLTIASQSFIRSVATLSGRGSWWSGALMADAYQTIDAEIGPGSEPYDRLPRGWFRGLLPVAGNVDFRIDAEAINFARDIGVEGARVDLYPRFEAPVYRPGWYVLPSLGVRYTAYDLERNTLTGDDSPSRTTGIASVESGLIFERRTGSGRLQTLEPRAHYLYVPFESQDDIPQFDTAELTFGFDQLFRTNRFTGADRQADANQLGLGVTTRIFDDGSTRETLTASLGTIVYFRDQRVQLAGQPEADDDTSPIVAELTWRPSDHWRTSFGFQYDPEDDEFDQTNVALQRRLDGGGVLNFAYRRREDIVRQVDASVYWPINERWSAVGRFNYSFLDDEDLETLLGFEYESCCWAVRVLGRRYLRNQEGDKRNSILFELELKGLGALGRNTERVLEQSIIGYRSQTGI